MAATAASAPPVGIRRASAIVFVGLLLMTVGGVALSIHAIVRGHLLASDTYASALAENEVYERVYSEVLIDASVRDFTRKVLGDL